MGLALRLEDYVPADFGLTPLPVDYWATAGAATRREAARQKLIASVHSVDERLKEYEAGLARLIALVESAIREGEEPDLDSLIQDLQVREKELAAFLGDLLADAGKARRIVLKLPNRAERVRLLAPLDRQIANARRAPEILRDARWELMALRAEKERGGDGSPVFDDVDDLLRYLDQL